VSNTANFDHNNSGREFEMAGGDTQTYQGAGGQAPKGLNAYDPSGGPRDANGNPPAKLNLRTKAGREAAARALFMNKFSSALKVAAGLGCAVDQNAWPQRSDTAENRPKYDLETAPIPETIGQDRLKSGYRYKRYLMAAGVPRGKAMEKVAKESLEDRISRYITEGIESGHAAVKGIKSTGSHTVGETLKLKGLKHVPEAAKAAGGMGKALASKAGRLSLWHAAGKSAPSAAALGLYGGIAYKGLKGAYNRLSSSGSYGSYPYGS
jgi:hypothetical protein